MPAFPLASRVSLPSQVLALMHHAGWRGEKLLNPLHYRSEICGSIQLAAFRQFLDFYCRNNGGIFAMLIDVVIGTSPQFPIS